MKKSDSIFIVFKKVSYVILLFPFNVLCALLKVLYIIATESISGIRDKIVEFQKKWCIIKSIWRYKVALASDYSANAVELVRVAEELQHIVKRDKKIGYFEGHYRCTDMIGCLKNLSLPTSTYLNVRRCCNVDIGDRSRLYISKGNICDYSIWDYIAVEDSHMGAWQTYLLYSVWHTLPFLGHGLYDKRSYIYSENDIARIEFITNEVPKAAMSIQEFNIIPELVKKGSKYYVTCCYWNNWTGLNREVVEITIENNMVKEIEVIETYNLIKYHCGILY